MAKSAAAAKSTAVLTAATIASAKDVLSALTAASNKCAKLAALMAADLTPTAVAGEIPKDIWNGYQKSLKANVLTGAAAKCEKKAAAYRKMVQRARELMAADGLTIAGFAKASAAPAKPETAGQPEAVTPSNVGSGHLEVDGVTTLDPDLVKLIRLCTDNADLKAIAMFAVGNPDKIRALIKEAKPPRNKPQTRAA